MRRASGNALDRTGFVFPRFTLLLCRPADGIENPRDGGPSRRAGPSLLAPYGYGLVAEAGRFADCSVRV